MHFSEGKFCRKQEYFKANHLKKEFKRTNRSSKPTNTAAVQFPLMNKERKKILGLSADSPMIFFCALKYPMMQSLQHNIFLIRWASYGDQFATISMPNIRVKGIFFTVHDIFKNGGCVPSLWWCQSGNIWIYHKEIVSEYIFIICTFYLRVLFSGCYSVSRMEHVPYGWFYDTRSGWRDVNYWALWNRRNMYYKLRSSTN